MLLKKKISLLKGSLAFAFLLLVIASIGLTVYCRNLSLQIDKRFSGRRWSVPSKVLSDTTLLYPGQRVNRALLQKKLEHLGYRQCSYSPTKKGEMRSSPSQIEIFLHDMKTPQQTREGFPASLQFSASVIESIVNSRTGQPVPLLELVFN
jgi:Bifunctional transglycosylase second domain